jgi:ferredoxin
MEPLTIPPIKVAADRGLTTGRVEDVEILGLPLKEARLKGFRYGTATKMDTGVFPKVFRRLGQKALAARTVNGRMATTAEDYDSLDVGTAPHFLRRWATRQMVANPYATEKCVACQICERSCPVQAITMVNGRAHMDWNKCIRCYCCHEVCPENAIELRRTLIGRLMSLGG